MSEQIHASDFTLTPFDNRRLVNLCGRFNEHLKQIERQLGVEISNRGNHFQVVGQLHSVKIADLVINDLWAASRNTELTPSDVHLSLRQHAQETDLQRSAHSTHAAHNVHTELLETEASEPILRTRTGEVRPRSPNQALYVQNIFSHDINFGIGPAGTGKTFLAVAAAVHALEQEKIRRILLVRPAVEAGERLGFLPGDLAQKIDPYLRPLYDALYEMLGYERVSKLMERQVIEIASLAYMRGRTLNDSFIILDEGQNTTIEQMKMFLTRIGFSSTAVVTGDITQVDLPRGKQSGLRQVIGMLQGIPGISFSFFQSTDVVRHPVVQKIIEAYDRFDKSEKDQSRDA